MKHGRGNTSTKRSRSRLPRIASRKALSMPIHASKAYPRQSPVRLSVSPLQLFHGAMGLQGGYRNADPEIRRYCKFVGFPQEENRYATKHREDSKATSTQQILTLGLRSHRRTNRKLSGSPFCKALPSEPDASCPPLYDPPRHESRIATEANTNHIPL